LMECDTDWIEDGDIISVDLDSGTVSNTKTGEAARAEPIPKTMQILLEDGGLVAHLKKHGGFALR